MRLRVALVTACLVLGCAKERIRPPATPAPKVDNASDAIPADLDVVVRIQWAALRSAIPGGASALWEKLFERGTDSVLAEAYARADVVWVAFRPGAGFEPVDAVVVLRGRFRGFDPRARTAGRWLPPRDLGAGWRRWDRTAAPRRDEWMRIYERHDELLVALTVAELDSVERVIERGAKDSRVRAPERGLISAAARLGGWVDASGGPRLRWLAGAESLEGYLDLSGDDAVIELDLLFPEGAAARRAADGIGLFLEVLARDVEGLRSGVRDVTVSVVGEHVVLRYAGNVLEASSRLGAVPRLEQAPGDAGSRRGEP